MTLFAGVDVLKTTEDNKRDSVMTCYHFPSVSKSLACTYRETLGTREVCASLIKYRKGLAIQKQSPEDNGALSYPKKKWCRNQVLRSNDKDGCKKVLQEVGALHSTVEGGERTFARSQWRKGGANKSQSEEGNMLETQSSNPMSTSLFRLAELGRTNKNRCFTNLNQYLTKELLETAFYQTKKDGAPGVDGQTKQDYAKHLNANLESLLDRVKSGNYIAPPVRRVFIPKGKGHRAIGIPTFEDKVLQKAVTLILQRLYEPVFHGHSFAYREQRNAHQALALFRETVSNQGGGYVVELDIQSFFDNLDQGYLKVLLKKRIGDGVITCLINKWLKAGVMENGNIRYPGKGSPQGGVISPMLSNIYLDAVLDQWIESAVKPRLINKATLIRFADDAVLIMKNRKDAEKVMAVLPKRFSRFGLSLHPEKTRLIDFTLKERNTIDFLGFTHFWKRSRTSWGIGRKTMKDRLARSVRDISQWCRDNRFRSLQEQYKKLCEKVNGHYAYFSLKGNIKSLKCFRFLVERVWLKWLRRRSHRQKLFDERVTALFNRYCLPTPKILARPASVIY